MGMDVLGIDVANQIFQIHGADRRGRAVHRSKVSRSSFFESGRALNPKLVVMEACSPAHHWGRRYMRAIEERVHLIEASIQTFMKKSTLCRKIVEIPGIGPITATAVVAAVGDARQFRNGRHLSAWPGLVPRQYSSGGKARLHGISRRGDTYLRTLLIHGARAVLRYTPKKSGPQRIWLQDWMARRGHNCAAVALANRNARIIKALTSSDATSMTRSTAA